MKTAVRSVQARAGLASDAPVRSALGYRFSIPPGTTSEMLTGTFESLERQVVLDSADWAEVLVNVGANCGYHACSALSKGIRTIAIEPEPMNVSFLLKNVVANDWHDQVEIIPVALGAREGVARFYGGGTGGSLIAGWARQRRERLVAVCTLDDLLYPRLVQKRVLAVIDVEGGEFDVLLGAQAFLHEAQSVVFMMEVTSHQWQPNGRNDHFARIFNLLGECGFKAFDMKNPQQSLTDAEVLGIEAGAIRSGHNFMFVKGACDAPSHPLSQLRRASE